MKKVFEGGLSKVRGIKPKFEMDYRLAEWLELNLPWDRPVRIAVEELPEESKPEKNCGNCAHNTKYPNPNCEGTSCKETGYSLWQPKPAEPQSWEQRICMAICSKEKHTSSCEMRTCNKVKSFIRAEIERVREEEKQLFIKTFKALRDKGVSLNEKGSLELSKISMQDLLYYFEQNKHRSEK